MKPKVWQIMKPIETTADNTRNVEMELIETHPQGYRSEDRWEFECELYRQQLKEGDLIITLTGSPQVVRVYKAKAKEAKPKDTTKSEPWYTGTTIFNYGDRD